MRNPLRILNSLKEHSKDKKYHYERLYRILYNQDMFLKAYQNIYSKEGNMTEGVDGKTIDGMSVDRINLIINLLRTEQYQPIPSRRTYIPKKDGKKKRPLGIPSFNDKLVQEVLKMILEAIYEDSFSKNSHGFRNNKSCHTALNQIQKSFTGCRWFIEGDIKGFFDNIDHEILIKILAKRIKDDKFLRLIRKFLKAGYMENWQFHNTYSGTPQGGIVSPILANIYLNELDKYIEEYKKKYDKGIRRARNPEYRKYETKLYNARQQFKNSITAEEKKINHKKLIALEQERVTITYGINQDNNYKRLQYVRYCDDFLIGVIGSKADCENIKADIKEFLQEKLNLELSIEKTLITNASKEKAKFLGYDIYVRSCNEYKQDKLGRRIRDYTKRVVLAVSIDTIRNKLIIYDAIKFININGKEVWKPKSRNYLKNCDKLEILDKYNAEIRGFYNYYSIANNSSIISKFKYIMEYSMYKTYANKYRTTVGNIKDKLRLGKNLFGVKYKNSKGEEKVRIFYNEGFARKKEININKNIDNIPKTNFTYGRTSLLTRLTANKCEYCGATDVPLEVHHIRKMKDLKGKEHWEEIMIARKRKTMILCKQCHVKLHCGKLD